MDRKLDYHIDSGSLNFNPPCHNDNLLKGLISPQYIFAEFVQWTVFVDDMNIINWLGEK